MKKFKEYLAEEVLPQSLSDKGFIGIEDESVRDNINSLLNGVTTKPVVTPYISLERVRKVLAYYHIFLPANQFMRGDCGNKVFNISQFGEKFGMTNDGEVITKSDSPYYLYFEYQMNDYGLFDVYTEIVEEDELEELLSDFEDETDDNEDDSSEVISADQQNNYLINKDKLKGNVQEETINEIADTKKGKIVLKKVINKAFKKYYDAYDAETDARAEVQKKRTPESRKGAENARAVKIKAKDRVVRFQQYADKKKLKENKNVP